MERPRQKVDKAKKGSPQIVPKSGHRIVELSLQDDGIETGFTFRHGATPGSAGSSDEMLLKDSFVVRRVFKKSWAEQNGVLPGDVLQSVNGRLTEGMSYQDLENMLAKRP